MDDVNLNPLSNAIAAFVLPSLRPRLPLNIS